MNVIIFLISILLSACPFESENSEKSPEKLDHQITFKFKKGLYSESLTEFQIRESEITKFVAELGAIKGHIYGISTGLAWTVSANDSGEFTVDFSEFLGMNFEGLKEGTGIKTTNDMKLFRIATRGSSEEFDENKYTYHFGFYDGKKDVIFMIIYFDKAGHLSFSESFCNVEIIYDLKVPSAGFYAIFNEEIDTNIYAAKIFSISSELYYIYLEFTPDQEEQYVKKYMCEEVVSILSKRNRFHFLLSNAF